MLSLKYQLVDYALGSEGTVLASFAAQSADLTGVGQQDAVQLVTGLAALQSAVIYGAGGEAALYDEKNRFRGRRLLSESEVAKAMAKGQRPLFIVGEPGILPQNKERRRLALALEGAVRIVQKSRQGGDPQYESVTAALPAVAALAVIVGGIAASVVASVAAWRFFDPEEKRKLEIAKVAADSYTNRLRTFRETGTMPPPAPVEQVPELDALASEGSKARWPWAAAGAAAVAVPTLATTLINR